MFVEIIFFIFIIACFILAGCGFANQKRIKQRRKILLRHIGYPFLNRRNAEYYIRNSVQYSQRYKYADKQPL